MENLCRRRRYTALLGGGLVLAAVASFAAAPPETPQEKPFEERVEVERVVVDAHVIDRFSVPIQGLTIEDFVVEVDGKPVALESVEWVGTGPEPGAVTGDDPQGAAPGAMSVSVGKPRLLVILFQWELAGQKAAGFLRMQRQAIEFVRRMQEGDRAAVFLYDSRLWLRQDVTGDRTRLEDTVRHVLRQEEDRENASMDSLSGRLSADDARTATSIEKALAAIGDTLLPITGKKSLLFFGWQMGEWTGRLTSNYDVARRALAEAETSVFVLDVSDGRHKLAGGLRRIARDTGGLYQESFDFPRFAMRAVERALSGYYVLVFRRPDGPRAEHEIEIRLADREGTVTHRRFYQDGAR